MRYIILILILFVCINSGHSQKWRNISLDIELFSQDLGYLDPLFVNIVFENKGNRKIKNINSLESGLIISYKPFNEKKWEPLRYFNFYSPYHTDKFDIPPNYSSKKEYFILFPVLSDYSIFPGTDANMNKNKGLYQRIPGVCFKPGKYKLKITYFPFKYSRNDYLSQDERCKKCIEKSLVFEVGNYKNEEDKAAYNWLLTFREPNFIYQFEPYSMHYFPSSFDPNVKIYLEELIERFPNSVFAPYAAYKSLFIHGSQKLTPITDLEILIDFYEKELKKIEFIKEKSKNMYILREIDSTQKIYAKKLRNYQIIKTRKE